MRTIRTALLALLCAGMMGTACGQNSISLGRWDAGASGGAVLYGDVVGLNGMVETRVYLLKTDFDFDAFAGAGVMYQYAAGDNHSMANLYGSVLGGGDWFFLRERVPALETLALRAQLALGGGYTSDKNTDGTVAGHGGYLVHPALGADYGFGRIHASLLFGYEVIASGGTVMTAPTLGAGISYSLSDRSEK
ncbi:MAG: hypothetical protein WCG80_15025 [Spirochaetales bacterium]